MIRRPRDIDLSGQQGSGQGDPPRTIVVTTPSQGIRIEMEHGDGHYRRQFVLICLDMSGIVFKTNHGYSGDIRRELALDYHNNRLTDQESIKILLSVQSEVHCRCIGFNVCRLLLLMV
jgi:hypothetical protein